MSEEITVTLEPTNVAISYPGPQGVGVPSGGSTGQALTKASGDDADTEWSTLATVATSGLLSDITGYSVLGFQIFQAMTASDVRDLLSLGSAALDDAGDFAAASHTHTADDITDLDPADFALAAHTHAASEITGLGYPIEIGYTQSGSIAVGIGGRSRTLALTDREIVSVGFVLGVEDTGTLAVRILSAAGVVLRTATVSVTDGVSAIDSSLSWDSGDGSVEAGQIIEVERTSGFAITPSIRAVVRMIEDA